MIKIKNTAYVYRQCFQQLKFPTASSGELDQEIPACYAAGINSTKSFQFSAYGGF